MSQIHFNDSPDLKFIFFSHRSLEQAVTPETDQIVVTAYAKHDAGALTSSGHTNIVAIRSPLFPARNRPLDLSIFWISGMVIYKPIMRLVLRLLEHLRKGDLL